MNSQQRGGGKASSPYAIEADLQKIGSSEGKRVSCLQEQAARLCHSEPYYCQAEDETIKVSGEESLSIKSGILRAKNNCHPQNDVTANENKTCSNSQVEIKHTPSTYGRGKEFQHDKGVLEIQGEGAICVCQRCKKESSLFNNPKAGLPRRSAPRNDGHPLSHFGRWNSSHVKNLVPYYLSALVPSNKIAFTLAEVFSPYSSSQRKAAFTLAEVLITLGIIGVVAAMTMPALINKNDERVTVTKVKKFYSVMNQALLFAIKDNGYVDEWNFHEKDEENNIISDKFVEYIKPYLKISKDCGGNSGCIGETYKQLDGSVWTNNYDPSKWYYKMILADGSYLWIRTEYNGSNMECSTLNSGTENVCGVMWTDINGKRPPNTIGKDVFVFFILKNRIIPHSGDNCRAGETGWGCSAYILQHGDMNYLHK